MLEAVVAGAPVHVVVPTPAVYLVGGALAQHLVIARIAEQAVVPFAAMEEVVAGAPVHAVIPAAGVEREGLRARGQNVGARPGVDGRRSRENVTAVSAEVDRVGTLAEIQLVGVEAVESLADEDVVVAGAEVDFEVGVARAADPGVLTMTSQSIGIDVNCCMSMISSCVASSDSRNWMSWEAWLRRP